MIYRDKNDERLYSLADPNWNVVAICNEDGFVEERFNYDAFGKINGLSSDWNRAFTGQVLDHETALMLYRNRFYHTDLGRFEQRDMIGYSGGDVNLYRYVFNGSVITLDPAGLQQLPSSPIFGDPKDYADQIPVPPVPPPAPTPTGDGCPSGWKMVQDTPPVANGCGPAGNGLFQGGVRILTSTGQTLGGIDFTSPCNNHDLCWGNCSSNRKNCDDQFLKEMRSACNKKYPGKEFYMERQWCLLAARKFHSAVSGSNGNSSFANARANHCKCVCEK